MRIRSKIDAQFLDQGFRHSTVRSRTFDGESPAVSKTELIAHAELISLGVATEVIVVVEDENARLRSGHFPEIMSSREATDSAPHYNQVISFASFRGLAGVIPKSSIAQAVSCVE